MNLLTNKAIKLKNMVTGMAINRTIDQGDSRQNTNSYLNVKVETKNTSALCGTRQVCFNWYFWVTLWSLSDTMHMNGILMQ